MADPAPAAPPSPAGGTVHVLRQRFLDLSVSTKLAVLVAAGLAALATCMVVMTISTRDANRTSEELSELNQANAVVLQLDRYASELKVNGLQAVLRSDPAAQPAKVEEQGEQTTKLLTTLKGLDLATAEETSVSRIEKVLKDYLATITTFVEGAATDQAGARLTWEQIDVDNYLVSAVLRNERTHFLETIDADEKLASDKRDRQQMVLWATAVIAALLLCLLAWAVVQTITRPLLRVRRALDSMAEGDLTVEAGVRSRDEVGRMAQSLERARSGIRSLISSVSGSAAAVAAAAEEMSATSDSISGSAGETAQQAQAVSDAAGSVSNSVQVVALGSREMEQSIGEIAHNANDAVKIAGRAVEVAESATAQVGKLGDSSQQIASVLKVITSIAEQTNLLALNATIEAARAGDAGKGFAVVANEVKDLAQETAKATEDIARQIDTIQADTAGAVSAIGEISSVIGQINEFQAGIAGAVEQQTATTTQMNRSVAEAAQGAQSIASTISGVATASQTTTDGVDQSRQAVGELSQMAHQLHDMIARFRY
ncbi:MAG: methyl-accepting chemotaxis protein [Actinomycetota bacterium]|nr:methyl-accepting chemotaxis protein [Actinomycetota bacterium]